MPLQRHILPASSAHRRAFTLIEVLLALAIFAIGFAMIATVPAGASLMEKRFERLVESELAAHNAMQVATSRKAFWPVHEFSYAGHRSVGIDAAYHPGLGTNQLPKGVFSAFASGPLRYDTSGVAGGLLTPMVAFRDTANSIAGPDLTAGDADAQGDFEDYACNPGFDVGGDSRSSTGGPGWGMVCNNVDNLPDVFKRTFDTDGSGLVENNLYCKTTNPPNATSIQPYGYYFGSTPGSGVSNDRTDFTKGRIHCCHNRLTPPNLFPLERRSYPTTVPLDRRRVFVDLSLHDKNASESRRSWVVYAAAMQKHDPDDRWSEANDWQKNNPAGALPIPLPNPSTRGDLSVYSTAAGPPTYPGGPVRMTGNIFGLYDSRAAVFTNTPSSDPAITGSGNAWYNHRYISLCDNTGYIFWARYGRVAPMGSVGPDAVNYPSLMSLPAIIYDWDSSLIQVAYPKEYVPVDGQPDRRLKIGDPLLTLQGGLLLSVKSVWDETRPQYAVADRPYFQIVEVIPPLAESPLGGPAVTGAADAGVGNQGHGGNAYPYWRLSQVFFSPGATGKTVSPWNVTHVIPGDALMTSNPNQ